MTYQRRRGLPCLIWPIETQTDSRGNKVKVAVEPSPDTKPVKVWLMGERGARAEVPGQQRINLVRIGTGIHDGIEFWARADFMGKSWDVASPPEYHHGSRATRHYSLVLRERPS